MNFLKFGLLVVIVGIPLQTLAIPIDACGPPDSINPGIPAEIIYIPIAKHEGWMTAPLGEARESLKKAEERAATDRNESRRPLNAWRVCMLKARIAELEGGLPGQTSPALAANAAAMEKRRPSASECKQKIIAIHQKMDRELTASKENESAEEAARNRSRQGQMDLFAGECSHHPEAASYVRSAQEQLSNSSNSERSTVAAFSRSQPEESRIQNSGDSRKHYIGQLSELCVRYRFLRNSGIAAWFELSNGCNETIKVWHSGTSGTNLTSLSIIKPLSKTESWFDNRKASSIRYVGCRETSDGKDVHLDKEAGLCFIRR